MALLSSNKVMLDGKVCSISHACGATEELL